MNRLWFAFAFIALAVLLCTYEQYTVKTTFENLETILGSMDTAAKNEDYKEVEKKCKQLEDLWTAKYPHLSAVTEHSALRDAGVTIYSIRDLAKNKSDDLSPTIHQAQTEIKGIYDESKDTLGNIF